MKEQFITRRISLGTTQLIAAANTIISEYYERGYILTVRQVYYQFVARDLIPNEEKWYKRIVNVLNIGRLLGLLDWSAVEDRTRSVREPSTWDSVQQIVLSARQSYAVDRWSTQSYRIEVWVEKDALVGIVADACREPQVPYFSCRGYASQSSLYRASKRLKYHMSQDQMPIILHLGDHDPSGIDMTRDIQDRLSMFTHENIIVRRIALNMQQIAKYKPPPNPAKLTDTRAKEYVNNWGYECWELDALDPEVMTTLIQESIDMYCNKDLWEIRIQDENEGRERLQEIADEL